MIVLKGDFYYDKFPQYPMVQVKYYHGICLNDPQYYPNEGFLDEIFVYVDNRVILNIMYRRYMISNFGRVFDCALGKFMNPASNAGIKHDGTANPYWKVKLAYYRTPELLDSEGEYIHRLVLLHFDYKYWCELYDIAGLQANHMDGNHANNRLNNLCWVTKSENVRHAYDTGLMNSKLVTKDLPQDHPLQPINIIREKSAEGYSNKEIAEFFNIDPSIVSRAVNYKVFADFGKLNY